MTAAELPGDARAIPSKSPGDNPHMQEPLELLVTTEMPYGKYKGTPIADLPGNYLNWFAREGFPQGQLGRLLALMHEIDHNGLGHLLRPVRDAHLQGPAL